jgi:hypothetical protein
MKKFNEKELIKVTDLVLAAMFLGCDVWLREKNNNEASPLFCDNWVVDQGGIYMGTNMHGVQEDYNCYDIYVEKEEYETKLRRLHHVMVTELKKYN